MAGTTTRKKTASKTTKRKPARREPTMADRLRVPSIPELDQKQADVWGVGLVLASVLFAFVFYFGWDGGKVGSGNGDGGSNGDGGNGDSNNGGSNSGNGGSAGTVGLAIL